MEARSLDELLLRRWDLAESTGVMRTDVNDTIRRRIPGNLGLVVQFNPSHLKVRGHLLFVLDMNLLKPQKMSEKFLLYALSISQAMQNETFALGTSTIHAGADATSVVKTAWALLALLQARGIPHNLLVVSNVVFVFPRKEQRENGVGLFSDDSSTDGSVVHAGRLRVAVAELSGLVIAGDQVAHDSLTEEMFDTILQNEVSLPSVISVKHFEIHRIVGQGGFGKVNAVIRKKSTPTK
ncbi:hypothetical protein PHYSODRAFT_469271, partial [Phytophthora sojae]